MTKFQDIIVPISIGLIVRLGLTLSSYQLSISKRVEVSTPTNDWKRAYEGIHLLRQGISPYEGDTFHEYPINLYFYKILDEIFGQSINILFIFVDCVTGFLLSQATLRQILVLVDRDALLRQDKLLTPNYANRCSLLVLWIYCLLPATILPCVGQSTTVFTNFLIATICLSLAVWPHRKFFNCFLLALLACNVLHYVTLAFPAIIAMELYSRQKKTPKNVSDKSISRDDYISVKNILNKSIGISLQLFALSIAILLVFSYILIGRSTAFFDRTFLFVLKINDLTPNIGMCWYFFTEMFDHFQSFFLWVFHINAFIHAIPLSIYLHKNPFFAFYAVLVCSTFVLPYPSLANIGLVISLLPQWRYLLNYTMRGVIASCAIATCMTLAPILWHLWIVMGSANANFYFGTTLAFVGAQVMILIEILSAQVTRNSQLPT